jgi:hypothetical protein
MSQDPSSRPNPYRTLLEQPEERREVMVMHSSLFPRDLRNRLRMQAIKEERSVQELITEYLGEAIIEAKRTPASVPPTLPLPSPSDPTLTTRIPERIRAALKDTVARLKRSRAQGEELTIAAFVIHAVERGLRKAQ